VGRWAAELKADGTFVGRFSLRPVRPTDEPVELWEDAWDVTVLALGYRLRRSAWGHGYAAEGATALVAHAFTVPGVERVVATTMAVNLSSRRVMERAGLRYLGTRHIDWSDPLPGSEQGEAEYGLTRSEWLSAQHGREEWDDAPR
jgi:RimJ/RimL family protein N-acetyltransferase